jgi:hypothetical protein
MSEASKRKQDWIKENWRRCETRRSGLSAHLNTAFWTILCVAFLSYRSVQSLTKNQGHDREDEGVDGLP